MKKQLNFPLGTALASAMLNLVLIYILGAVFLLGRLSMLKLFLLDFTQFALLIIIPILFISSSFRDYVTRSRSASLPLISSGRFWKTLCLFYLIALVVFFQLIPEITHFVISDRFGSYLDRMVGNSGSAELDSESFSRHSFLVQNIFLVFFGFVLSVICSNAYYRKLLKREEAGAAYN